MATERGARSLELLWGRRDRPSRGPKPKLTVEQIVASAIEIADREGIDAVSMQRVATDHGYTTMSLYRYVPGKEELLDLMIDTAIGPAPAVAELGSGWREQIEGWTDRMWTTYQRHPWVIRVQIARPPLGPNQLSWFECGLQALSGAGISADETVFACLYLSASIRGLAGIADDLLSAQRTSGGMSATSEYAAELGRLIDPERFPALIGVLGAGTFGGDADADDAPLADVRPELDYGVARFLDGIEANGRRKATRRAPRQTPPRTPRRAT